MQKLVKRFAVRGKVGVGPNIKIADDVSAGAKTGVVKNIDKSGVYHGMPVQEGKTWIKRGSCFKKTTRSTKENSITCKMS